MRAVGDSSQRVRALRQQYRHAQAWRLVPCKVAHIKKRKVVIIVMSVFRQVGVSDSGIKTVVEELVDDPPNPGLRPEHCGFVNEDLECLGCGVKLGCVKKGFCYRLDGQRAFK